MGEGLSFDNILEASEIASFFEDEEESQVEQQPEEKSTETNEQEATEIPIEELFESESVGSEENHKEGEGTESTKGKGTSPNFYSSIAKALKEEGIFPDLDDETIEKTSKPENFRDLIDRQIKAGLDEAQKRVNEALNAGMEPDDVRQFENTLNYLDTITDKAISEESDKAETLRKNLIYQDFINRGYSKERANKEVQKSINAGTDIEDAKEALQSNKEYFKEQYDDAVKEGKEAQRKVAEEKQKETEQLRKSILEDKKVFGEIEIDKATRQKVYDNIAKPIYKDKDGNLYNAIQKYEIENRIDFVKNLSLLFTLTDGFKNIDKLVKDKVKKEVGKGLRDLENKINTTSRAADGSLSFVTSARDDDSYSGIDWSKLNV